MSLLGKFLTIQEMTESSEQVFKFVRIHETKYGWFWRFCHMDVDHTDMVAEDEVPLSAGFIFVVEDEVLFPEEINLPNFSTTLEINASKRDYEDIPLLFGGQAKVIDGKYFKDELRDTDDSSPDGDEGAH